jgi:flagellar basal body-associated protein FliL
MVELTPEEQAKKKEANENGLSVLRWVLLGVGIFIVVVFFSISIYYTMKKRKGLQSNTTEFGSSMSGMDQKPSFKDRFHNIKDKFRSKIRQ